MSHAEASMSSTEKDFKILQFLLDTGKYTDLRLECGEIELKVHRSIVCAQSEFFDAACHSGFKESLEGVIKLPEDEPETIQRLVSYFYTGDYVVDETNDESVNVLLCHIRMFDVAVRYTVRGLNSLVLKKFSASLPKVGEDIPNAFVVQSIQEIFTTIPEDDGKELRDAMLSSTDGYKIVSRVFETTEFRELCLAHGEIGLAMLLAKPKTPPAETPLLHKLLAVGGSSQLGMVDLINILNSRTLQKRVRNNTITRIDKWQCPGCSSPENYGCHIKFSSLASSSVVDSHGGRYVVKCSANDTIHFY